MKENKFLYYTLSLTWGLLWVIIGFIIFISAFLIFNKNSEIRIVNGRIVLHVLYKKFGGISLGLFIIASTLDSRLINHEIGHTIQNQWMGPLFIFLVAIPSGIRYQLWDWKYKSHLEKTGEKLEYDSIWFESQATKLGEKYYATRRN